MENTYMRMFDNEDSAFNICKIKNRACKAAGNYKDVYAVIDGPSDNWAVVDLLTAIEFGNGYQIVG